MEKTRLSRSEQCINAYADLGDFLAPKEELLTVAIDDTANAVFITGIARVFCHMQTFTLTVFYIHEIVKGTAGNPEVIPGSLPVRRASFRRG